MTRDMKWERLWDLPQRRVVDSGNDMPKGHILKLSTETSWKSQKEPNIS
jgi:hypothetical protein